MFNPLSSTHVDLHESAQNINRKVYRNRHWINSKMVELISGILKKKKHKKTHT